MKHSIPHDLDIATAKRAAEKALETYRTEYPAYHPTADWTSDRHAEIGFNAKGVALKGSLQIEPQEIVLQLDVPFLLRLFQGQAVKAIEAEVQTWIAKAKAGEI